MTELLTAQRRQLRLEDRLLLDRFCIEFEEQLHGTADRCLSLSDFMLQSPSEIFRRCLLYEVLRIEFDWAASQEVGELRAQYARQYPQYSEIVDFAWAVYNPLALKSGDRIAGYVIVRKLAHGSFGVVYLAEDASGRQVALKLIKMGDGDDSYLAATSAAEINSLQHLRHPHIIPLLDFGIHAAPDAADRSEIRFLAMPYLPGGTLSNELESGAVEIHRSISIILQIADALAYAHSQGIFHGDLKPSNLLLKQDGSVMVADFGLSVNLYLQRFKASEVSGSPRYMSPEQLRGESRWLDGRSDIWSLGVIFYVMLTGQHPFAESTIEGLRLEIPNHAPQPIRQIRPDVPKSLEETCMRCLQVLPRDRFATAGELLENLKSEQTKLLAASCESNRSGPVYRSPYSLTRRVVPAMSLGLLVLLSTVLFRNSSSPPHPVDRQYLTRLTEKYTSDGLRVENTGTEWKNGEFVLLPAGENALQLCVRSEDERFLYLFSVEPQLIHVVVPAENRFFPVNSEWASLPSLSMVYTGKEEYFVLVTCSSPLDISNPESTLRTIDGSRRVARTSRGVKVRERRLSVMYVPYRVVAPSTVITDSR